MADFEMWLIMGNAQNWGRGDDFRTALGFAIKNGKGMTEAHVYRLERDTEIKAEDLWCDDFGTVHYALDGKLTKLPKWKVPPKLIKAYSAFDEECEEVQYGGELDVFND